MWKNVINSTASKNLNDVQLTQRTKKQKNNNAVCTGGFLGAFTSLFFLSAVKDSEPIFENSTLLNKVEKLHKKFLNRGLESVFAFGAISTIVGTGILLGAGGVYIYQNLSKSSQKGLDKNVVQDDVSSTSDKKDFQATCWLIIKKARKSSFFY